MNQRPGITYRKPSGFSQQAIRIWGLLFLMCGAAGFGLFAKGLIPANGGDNAPIGMITVGMVLQVMHYCAIPVFSFLLVQGFLHTSSVKNYAIRVAILAVLTELPYNLCMSGNLLGAVKLSGGFGFDMAAFSLNPVFATLLSLAVLAFFRQYPGKETNKVFVKILVVVMAFLWAGMLRIENANIMLVLVAVLWAAREKKGRQVFFGCVATFLCSIFGLGTVASIGCFAAPLTFLLIHFYNEEQGEGNMLINYLAYPLILLAVGIATKFV